MAASSYLSLVESRLKSGDHLCSFHETKMEQAQLIFPFLKAGLAKREKCLYIADESTPEEIKAGLLMHGMGVQSHLRSGQLSILTVRQSYLRSGRFDPEAMISFWASAVDEALREGYSGLRATGETSWILHEPRSLGDLLQYEGRLNETVRNLPAKLLCQYNAKRFLADVIIKVLKAHPRFLLGLDLRETRLLRIDGAPG